MNKTTKHLMKLVKFIGLWENVLTLWQYSNYFYKTSLN